MNKFPAPHSLTLDLLRHGEPCGGERYRGRLDDPLSETGWQQMHAAVAPQEPWTHIISSPLQRCLHFAQQLAQQRQLPLTIEPALQELRFGRWEGRTATEILASPQAEALTAFWRDPWRNPPPEGETLKDFEQRVIPTLQNLIEHHPKGAHLLIVAHGGILRLATAWALGMPLNNLSRLVIPYACRIRLVMDHIEGQTLPRLLYLRPNDTPPQPTCPT
ncbi:transcriptional regulator, Fis family [Magnetococcus marinus MC-1]|uniref:Transcriptional regulator, Fis family n=1 Tax=Magnetococcus marinus (strain ATCC BAA-1437 / JCM 17883 / MC-1) TaxID=156889 RepID=A0L5I1_MAGMM|nr:histidine phosphatase family protein [Magnetococcus marinus]ABK43224.1 transcriptional regulator, Fis family [Magnetococcus marinus MC-1]